MTRCVLSPPCFFVPQAEPIVENALHRERNPNESGGPARPFDSIRRWLSGRSSRSMYALADQAAVSGTSLLTTIIVGRSCGSEGLGLFVLAFGVIILSRGIQETLVSAPYTVFRLRVLDRMPATVHAGATLVGAILLACLLVLAASVAATTLLLIGAEREIQWLAWALAVTIPFTLAREFARRFEMARMNMSRALVIDGSVAAIQLSLLLFLSYQGLLTSTAAILVIAVASGCVVPWWAINRRTTFQFDSSKLKPAIRHDWLFGRWLLADQLICFAQFNAVYWLLTGMINATATGIFAACASIAALASPFLQGVGNFLSPRFAEVTSHGSRRDTMQLYWRATAILAVVVTTFAVLATLLGDPLLNWIYHDPDYDGYGAVVGVLAFRLAFGIPALAAHHAVVAMEAPRSSALATLIGMIVTVAVSIPLISYYGVMGGAIAAFAGTGVECGLLVAVFRGRLRSWTWQAESATQAEAAIG